MFGKKKPQVAPAEDDAEARAKARRKKATRLPKGVKQLIGYDAMLRNGIASLGDGRWSATILFQDINYQLSPESHQMEIIDRWAKLINSFEAGQNVDIQSNPLFYKTYFKLGYDGQYKIHLYDMCLFQGNHFW